VGGIYPTLDIARCPVSYLHSYLYIQNEFFRKSAFTLPCLLAAVVVVTDKDASVLVHMCIT
jgi:hypothetical protein